MGEGSDGIGLCVSDGANAVSAGMLCPSILRRGKDMDTSEDAVGC